MKYYSLSLLILCFSFHIYSCEIKTYPFIIKINNVLDDQLIQSSTCSDEVSSSFVNAIQNAEGIIPADRLKNLMEHSTPELVIKPKKINVLSLSEEVSTKLKHKYVIKDLKSLYGNSSFNLDKKEEIEIECSSCDKLGHQNIKLVINHKTHWLTAKIGKKISVYKTARQITTQEKLLIPSDFNQESIITYKPESYFMNIDDIKYYRINRHLPQGTPLRSYHLTSKNLIQFGQKVNVNILNKSIQLKTTGIAKKAGKLGDFINIENPKSKKKYLGKVIDYNKVEVQL